MKKIKALIASPGLSGAGLVYDFLLFRDDFKSPFKNFPDDDQQTEFRFVSDPGGLNSLYNGLYKNFSINNASYVFREFDEYLNKLKKLSIKKNGKKKFIYSEAFFKEVELFIKKITKIQYYGLPQYFRLGLNLKEKIHWRLIRNFKTAQKTNYLKMIIPINRTKFIEEAQKMLENSLEILSNKKKQHYVIDQAINFWEPEESSIFFKNKKIVLITRDPRSIFASMKKRGSLSYPGHNVDLFIKWYKDIIKDYAKIKNNRNLIKIKYENFILNHEKESKKLLNFLNIKNLKKKKFDISKSKENIFKAKIYLTNRELKLIERKLKKYLQWPKKIYI